LRPFCADRMPSKSLQVLQFLLICEQIIYVCAISEK
jgi:hypothetical protein